MECWIDVYDVIISVISIFECIRINNRDDTDVLSICSHKKIDIPTFNQSIHIVYLTADSFIYPLLSIYLFVCQLSLFIS